MKIKIVNRSKHPLPSCESAHSAAVGLRASLNRPVILKSMERTLIPAGLIMELPEGFGARIRPRNGMALKKGIFLAGGPGTIDADYRGEIKPIDINLSPGEVVMEDGERVAPIRPCRQ